ncbi:MAG: PTS sugar transporter subunit IIA [Bifidobacteriaceae bacterium]|nr:PTS sugar transporter subunit IIA [Bifidobacteriaceae bacterium]
MSSFLQGKHFDLLREFPKDGERITSETLARKLNISVRSVKTYVGQIRSENPQLIVPTVRGYRLNNEAYQSMDIAPHYNFPTTPEKRALRIIRVILENPGDDLTLKKLAEQLFVTESTIRKLMPTIKQHLQSFDLSLVQPKGRLKIIGSELDKRRILSETIYLEFNDNILSLATISKAFPEYDVGALKNLLLEICNQNSYFINEYALIGLVLDLLIKIVRIKNNANQSQVDNFHPPAAPFLPLPASPPTTAAVPSSPPPPTAPLSPPPAVAPAPPAAVPPVPAAVPASPATAEVLSPSATEFATPELKLGEQIAKEIEIKYHLSFNQLELDELTGLLLSNITKVEYANANHQKSKVAVQNIVSPESQKLMQLIREELSAFDILDFDNEEVMFSFTLHVDNLLKRLRNNYHTKNPLTEQIQRHCTFIYELAVSTAGIINRETGHHLDAHEIAYIAFHIGVMLQFQPTLRNKARCVLVFPRYYNLSNQLLEQLTEQFGASIIFLGVVSNAEEISSFDQVDMVLTTIDFPATPGVQVIRISPFLNTKDLSHIKTGLNSVVNLKNMYRLRDHLMEVSEPELFMVNPGFSNEIEAIELMSTRLIERGYAKAQFTEQVLDRERSYSTAYGKVAIPHALHMNAIKTGICIAVSQKPIKWGERKVQVMILFAVNAQDKARFYDIFENLMVLLLEPLVVAQLSQVQTYDAFITTLLEFSRKGIHD